MSRPSALAASQSMRASWPAPTMPTVRCGTVTIGTLGARHPRQATCRGSPRGGQCDSARASTRTSRSTRSSPSARAAKDFAGFATVWSSQIFGADALTVLAVVAREVDGIGVGDRRDPRPSAAPQSARPAGAHGAGDLEGSPSRSASGCRTRSSSRASGATASTRPRPTCASTSTRWSRCCAARPSTSTARARAAR